MRLPLLLALAGTLLVSPAFASNTTTFPDNPYLSTGTVEGFRWVYVEPDAFVKGLTPVAPLGGPEAPVNADLHIKNDTIGWVKVTVNGVEVGILSPLVEGVLHDVKPGQYDVTVEMANKLRTSYRISTVAAPPPAPPKPAR